MSDYSYRYNGKTTTTGTAVHGPSANGYSYRHGTEGNAASYDDSLADVAADMMDDFHRDGQHYTAEWLKLNAVKAEAGPNPAKRVVVDLGIGDSIDRLDSTKGQTIPGPRSVEVIFWPDGGIDQNIYEFGEAPEMPRFTEGGRFISPRLKGSGRKTGEYYDTQTFEWNGEAKTVREWYDHPDRLESLKFFTFSNRLKKQGMSVQEALTTPVVKGGYDRTGRKAKNPKKS